LVGLAVNRVYQGDCIELLGQIAPGTVHLAFADPPFNIGYEYDVYEDEREAQDYLSWSRDWISGVHQALRPDGTFWLAIGDEYAAELKMIAQHEVGFTCRSWVIWYYTFGVNCKRGFSRSHTHLFHFVKHAANFTFNEANPAVRVPSARQLVYADARANPRGRLPDNTWILRPQDLPHGFAADQDTWYYARVAGTFKEREGFHGCQMPEQLLGRIIRISSNPTDVVLDPFGGSGTTLAVAKKLGRQWIGFELSEDYARRVRERLDQARVGDPLDGPENPLQSAPSTKKGKRKKMLRGSPNLRKGRAPMPEALRKEIACGVIEAYKATRRGYSADYILADPELNAAFVEECRSLKVPGDAVIWNQMLLRVRKQGRLPRMTKRSRPLAPAEIESCLTASEVALQVVSVEYDTTLDGILCDPELAATFDRVAASFDRGQHTPRQYRWAALTLRKGAKDAKRLAANHRDWLTNKLPSTVRLARWQPEEHDYPGVFLLYGSGRVCLYVGEARCVGRQVQEICETPAWQELQPASVRAISADEHHLPGLKSVLIERTNPILNSKLLLPKLEMSPV
jgi:site-specific DNA-methyltransferase (adenine-specific)